MKDFLLVHLNIHLSRTYGQALFRTLTTHLEGCVFRWLIFICVSIMSCRGVHLVDMSPNANHTDPGIP